LHRERIAAQGLRPVRIWVPEARARSFIGAARKQSKAGADSIYAFTTDPTDAPMLRMLMEHTDRNGLECASRSMIDKITTAPQARLRKRIGKLNDEGVARFNRALMVFLGPAR
jgi:mRNA-degrading endonuclease toxin of MazEF toxin-antitoxin module